MIPILLHCQMNMDWNYVQIQQVLLLYRSLFIWMNLIFLQLSISKSKHQFFYWDLHLPNIQKSGSMGLQNNFCRMITFWSHWGKINHSDKEWPVQKNDIKRMASPFTPNCTSAWNGTVYNVQTDTAYTFAVSNFTFLDGVLLVG